MILMSIIFVLAYLLYIILPFSAGPNKGLVLLFCIGALWLTEAIHITVTALMVPVIAVLIGVPNGNEPITMEVALSAFANPVIFLFLGGFALAAALQSQHLDKKIVQILVRLTHANLTAFIILMFVITAFLSMWMSNSAAVLLMVPLALRFVDGLKKDSSLKIYHFVLLGIAYAATIGGLGTKIGSPPNAIVSNMLGYSFYDWFKIGIPLVLILIPLMIMILYWKIKPDLQQQIKLELEDDIPWTMPRILTILVFCLMVVGWLLGSQLKTYLGINDSDAWVALVGIFLMIVLGLTTWMEIATKTNWGILILFGGGLALSMLLKVSGASEVLGIELAKTLELLPHVLMILMAGLFTLILTEFTTNTATAALLVPIAASIAPNLGLASEVLVLVVGIGVSSAFMLPVATPPNAIVFATGHIQQKYMFSVGKFVSMATLGVMVLFISLIWL